MSNIPEHRHSDKELSDLRARSAMQAASSPIVAAYNKKLASKGLVILGYALPLIAPIWLLLKKMTKDKNYELSDFWIMVVPILAALSVALFIALKRVLSRHSAAFIVILSFLCGFAIVSAINNDKYLKYELMSLIGKDSPSPVAEGSDELSANYGSDSLTDAEREQLIEYDRERRAFEAGRKSNTSIDPTTEQRSPEVSIQSDQSAQPEIQPITNQPTVPIPESESESEPESESESESDADGDKAPDPVNPGIE